MHSEVLMGKALTILSLTDYFCRATLGTSHRETVEQIRENPYLQYFIGLKSYSNEAPFNAVMFVHFRQRINVELVHKLNQKMVKQAEEKNGEPQKSQEKELGEFLNQGRLILDATCAPADISCRL